MSIANTLLFILLVFITGTVSPFIGIANGNTFHLSILTLLCLLNMRRFYRTFNVEKSLHGIFFFFVFILVVTFILSQGDLTSVIGWITIPVICSLMLSLDKESLKGVQKVLMAFFIVECLLSIFERKNGVAIFPYVEDDYYKILVDQGQNWQFRSSSLLGNPLYNANFVSFALCLFLCCNNIKFIYRYLLALLGLFAILGFNARGATIVTVVLVIYKLNILLKEQKSKLNKYMFYILIVCSLYYAFDFVVHSDWGGRLIQDELVDGSAKTRLSFSEYIQKISLISFPSWVSKVNKSENSYLFILISNGVIMGVPLIYYLLKLFFHYIKPYKKQIKIILILSSIGIGSLNNNLAGPGLFCLFFMYLLAFRKELPLKESM